MFSALEHRLRKRASKWLMRPRAVEPGETFLGQRRVYIMPTHPGLVFCLMLLVLFLGSINYNLGLGFGFTFLIASCALVDMQFTFRNLAHLYLSAGRTAPVFAGEEAQFELHLINRRNYHRYALWLDFVGEGLPEIDQSADIAPHSTQSIVLSAPTTQRGWMTAPRVRLQTRFPLGLMRAWSYWQPDARTLVYPTPEDNAPPLPLAEAEKKDGQGVVGQDDFAGIRNYQAGDSLKRLAWRQIAKLDVDLGGTLVSKYFEGGATADVALDIERLPATLDVEAKLSRLTRWVLEAELRGLPYALSLGATRIEASSGPAHRNACLHALATYGAT